MATNSEDNEDDGLKSVEVAEQPSSDAATTFVENSKQTHDGSNIPVSGVPDSQFEDHRTTEDDAVTSEQKEQNIIEAQIVSGGEQPVVMSVEHTNELESAGNKHDVDEPFILEKPTEPGKSKVQEEENEQYEEEDVHTKSSSHDGTHTPETSTEASASQTKETEEYNAEQEYEVDVSDVLEANDDDSSGVSTPDADQYKDKIRDDLLEQYRQAVMEHKAARETNLQLQTKLAEYFRRKKADAAEQQSAASSMGGSTTDNLVDYEQRYNKYIASLMNLKNQYQFLQESYQSQIEGLKTLCAQRQKEVDNAYKEFTNYKLSIGKKALHSKTGRPINQKELLAMINAEQKKEAMVMEVRLENIKLKNEVAKLEAVLKSKEELAEGLHLIDFEQLKIENQTYNEKIEERHEELEKLKRKISNTVQIMTHVKEKLHAIQFENTKQRERLGLADAELTYNRDQLTKLKHARDKLRAENVKLRRSCGLLGRTNLLLNYEDSVDEVNSKKAAIEETKKITLQYINKSKSLVSKIQKFSTRDSML